MSSDSLDRLYEQELQAAARYLEVWATYADGRRIKRRIFMDTPEGRQAAAKNADTWMELPLVESVEVVPVGASGHGAGGEPRTRLGSSRFHETPAAPTRASCEAFARLCTPRFVAKPSGKRLCHSLDCPDKPGESISVREYAQGRTWPPRGRAR